MATDSAGQRVTGARVHGARTRYPAHPQRWPPCGTRSASKRLRRVAGRAARFPNDTKQWISKTLVAKAVAARKALARADRSGMRARTTGRRAPRYARHSWAVFPLRAFLADQAAGAGILVVLVDPGTPSRTGSHGGDGDQAHRKSQAQVLCQRCGYRTNADVNAAITLALLGARAAVNRPMVSPRQG